jgi:small subunit ribosomal protein S16
MVILRLSRFGRTSSPFYRLVAADKERWRDGKFIEALGNLNLKSNPPQINVKTDRIRHWISLGAQYSETVRSIIRKQIPGFIEELEKARLARTQASRKKRKAKLAKSSAKSSSAKSMASGSAKSTKKAAKKDSKKAAKKKASEKVAAEKK